MTTWATLGLRAALVAGHQMYSQYRQDQDHDLGEGDDPSALNDTEKPWVLAWENWIHGVSFKVFGTREQALEHSRGGLSLRRMIVHLDPHRVDIMNEHGQWNPWTEFDFDGTNCRADNNIRLKLRASLG